MGQGHETINFRGQEVT